jgi:hypothetical protein
MSKPNVDTEDRTANNREPADKTEGMDKLPWETPKMEDVSEQVMAQPYIRFT